MRDRREETAPGFLPLSGVSVQDTRRIQRIGLAQDVHGSLYMEVTDEIP
jgi:hypothetical protein